MTRSITLFLSVCLLVPNLADARRGGGRAHSGAGVILDPDERMEYGFYVSPLVGYESNYKLTNFDVGGSGIWALEGGGELKYRPSPSFWLKVELPAMIRMPFSDSGLTEFLVELPVMMISRPVSGLPLDLNLSNHVGFERARTTPVFLTGHSKSGETLVYYAVYEQLRAAAAYHFLQDENSDAFVELGPYFRIKQINLEANLDEPDYRLFDVGFDLSAKYIFRDRIAARVRYDLAKRWFSNFDARPPEYCTLSGMECGSNPLAGTELNMTRHTVGLYADAVVWGPVSVGGSYAIRFSSDNGGYYANTTHIASAVLGLKWPDLVTVEAGLTYMRYNYGDRAACEGDPTCSATSPNVLDAWESALIAEVRGEVTILEWLQAVVSYDMEDAEAENEDPIEPNHRVMGGISVSM
jgi:hypothetical protein